MPEKKRIHPVEKTKLHPRNKHRERYDFRKLTYAHPGLSQFVRLNDFKDESIDFFDPHAVKALNKALLKHFYGIENWDIPDQYLCAPIPGRADYIHHIADLLYNIEPTTDIGNINAGNKIMCLDIGVGANCVYPIIGVKEYGWSFVGTDIDDGAIEAAEKIVASNALLIEKIKLRKQINSNNIFHWIIAENDFFDITICNPPFHASANEANAASSRKVNNLKQKKNTKLTLNFGGKNNELWCEGGEEVFIQKMIIQSKEYPTQCLWFSTLISKNSTLEKVYEELKNARALEVKTIPLGQGNKISRIVAWTFHNKDQMKKWKQERWDENFDTKVK